MLIVGLVRWWYIQGWLEQLTEIRTGFVRLADRFSIGILLRTLFAPFRQISANESAHNNGGVLNVLADKLISRLVGGFLRTIMVLVGSMALFLSGLIGLVRLAIWPLLPILPVIGFIAMVFLGVPWTIA